MAKLTVFVAILAVAAAAAAAVSTTTAHGVAGGRRALDEYRSVLRVIVPLEVAGAPSSGSLDEDAAAALGPDLPEFGAAPAAGPAAAACGGDEVDCDNKVPVYGP
uniref:Uncharacterized protein n=1 Tax=Oryza glumipatula TaxID=40148 RepID=A0A0D9ZE01_9ORYZ